MTNSLLLLLNIQLSNGIEAKPDQSFIIIDEIMKSQMKGYKH